MAATDEEKGMKMNATEMINEYDGKSEFAYLRPADPSFWEKLWQTLETIATKSDSSPACQNDGFDEGFETWVHNRYKKRILYRYKKDFVLDMAALQSICVQFRLKRISEQAFNIITSTPKEIGLICEKLDGELQGYSESRRNPKTIDSG
ncbi:hypothetical protein N0V92_000951 [Colletotrichum tropicale]|nr:hypothetical protein N0V92_000951 [Colletotrichum tropicale]